MKPYLFFAFLCIVAVASIGGILANVYLCFPVQGIDHNASNDPFTIFLGWCE